MYHVKYVTVIGSNLDILLEVFSIRVRFLRILFSRGEASLSLRWDYVHCVHILICVKIHIRFPYLCATLNLGDL